MDSQVLSMELSVAGAVSVCGLVHVGVLGSMAPKCGKLMFAQQNFQSKSNEDIVI